MSLDVLRTAAHQAVLQLRRRRLELADGREAASIAGLASRLPEAFEAGAAREAWEAARSAEERGLAPRARRLKLLAATLVDLRSVALEPAAFARMEATPVASGGPADRSTAAELLRSLRRSTSREERRRLSALVDAAVVARSDDRRRRDEAGRRAATEAGFASVEDALGKLHGIDLPALRTMAATFLSTTEAMYRDVLGWWLERSVGLQVHPHGATSSDVVFALSGPLAPADRPAGDVAAGLLRLSRPLELGRRVRHELSSNPAAPDRPTAFVVDAPDDVRVVARRAEDWDDALAHLVAAGTAFHAAGVEDGRPAEDRLMGDAAVSLATGDSFGALLFDARWLKRALGAEGADLVRLLRLMDLAGARTDAAALLAWSDRLDGARVDEALTAERYSLALGGTVARGADSSDRTSADRFRARPAGAAMHAWLRERFDDDWWRNPAAGSALRGLFAGGGTLGLGDLAAVTGGPWTLERFAEVYTASMQ